MTHRSTNPRVEQAPADLGFWVDHARATGWDAERLARRAAWLDELRAGRDPFAGPDGLAKLEGE